MLASAGRLARICKNIPAFPLHHRHLSLPPQIHSKRFSRVYFFSFFNTPFRSVFFFKPGDRFLELCGVTVPVVWWVQTWRPIPSTSHPPPHPGPNNQLVQDGSFWSFSFKPSRFTGQYSLIGACEGARDEMDQGRREREGDGDDDGEEEERRATPL